MSRTIRNITAAAALVALAAAPSACGDPADSSGHKQTITGAIDTSTFDAPVLGVRAIRAGEVVATAPLRAGGAFSVELSTGQGYRLEVVTRDGSLALGSAAGDTMQAREFDVCAPIASYHVGAIRRWTGGGEGGDRPDGEPDSGGGSDPWPGDPGCGDDDGGGGSDPGHPDDCGCDEPPQPCWPGEDPDTDDCWEDPCWENPELCDPCFMYPELCDPCWRDPSLCECPEGSDPNDGECPPHDPCAENPEMCDPCIEHPDLCDPCPPGTDPKECWPPDPCMKDPSLCDDPCEIDPWSCECPEGTRPGPDGTCWPDDDEPPPCDPTFPESCEDPCVSDPWGCDPCDVDPWECECPEGWHRGPDGTCWPDDEPPPCDPTFPESCGECPEGTPPGPDGTCWPDDPECPYDDPMCWPEPPPCEDADNDGWCDGDGGCYAEQEVPDFGCE